MQASVWGTQLKVALLQLKRKRTAAGTVAPAPSDRQLPRLLPEPSRAFRTPLALQMGGFVRQRQRRWGDPGTPRGGWQRPPSCGESRLRMRKSKLGLVKASAEAAGSAARGPGGAQVRAALLQTAQSGLVWVTRLALQPKREPHLGVFNLSPSLPPPLIPCEE